MDDKNRVPGGDPLPTDEERLREEAAALADLFGHEQADDEDLVDEEDTGEDWWCWECQGLGAWEESGEDVDWGDAEQRVCECCGGDGSHPAGPAPECMPAGSGT